MNISSARDLFPGPEPCSQGLAQPAGELCVRPPEQPVLAVIPARGGSKGLPRKNIRNLCGKPLLAYSIEAALATPRITKVVVSTDDPRIADVAREHGAEVPFLRSPALGLDHSRMSDVLDETVSRLRKEHGFHPSVTVTLYPTHPFRTRELMNTLVDKALEGHRNVITVRRCLAGNLFTRDGSGVLTPARFGAGGTPGRGGHRFYGLFLASHARWCKPDYYHAIDDEVSLVDIDTLGDFLLAEEIVRRGMYDFNGGTAR
ncbi:MAG: cytidylyltransferase domain-containing protein [Thermodesulfobacteriota bacterium]